MIKASGRTADGRPLAVLGLSGENVTRLAANEPIVIDLAELGLPPTVVVLIYGRTEQTITDQLVRLGLVDPQTVAAGHA